MDMYAEINKVRKECYLIRRQYNIQIFVKLSFSSIGQRQIKTTETNK